MGKFRSLPIQLNPQGQLDREAVMAINQFMLDTGGELERLEGLIIAQQVPVVVESTEPESDQGTELFTPSATVSETTEVVDTTEPEPDQEPAQDVPPLSMSGFSPTATEDPDGKHVTLDWSDWPGVNNPDVKGYNIYYSTTVPCPITDANRKRRIEGNFTNVTLKLNISRNVNMDYRVQPFGKDERGKRIEGIASE